MAKVLQFNLNHCTVAQDILFQLVPEENSDIVVISEQYQDLSETNWIRSAPGKVAFLVQEISTYYRPYPSPSCLCRFALESRECLFTCVINLLLPKLIKILYLFTSIILPQLVSFPFLHVQSIIRIESSKACVFIVSNVRFCLF